MPLIKLCDFLIGLWAWYDGLSLLQHAEANVRHEQCSSMINEHEMSFRHPSASSILWFVHSTEASGLALAERIKACAFRP